LKLHHARGLGAIWIIIGAGNGAACTGSFSEAPFDERPLGAAGRPNGSEPEPSTQPDESIDAGAQLLDADAEPPGGDDASSALYTPSYCDAPTRVLQASCGNGSCHSNAGATIGDFAISPEHAAAFVDKVSVRSPTCGRIIDSRNYGDSLLLTKVTGTYPLHCGGRMPVGSFIITDDQIACLASWLQQFQR
jgi:hypothetical protein